LQNKTPHNLTKMQSDSKVAVIGAGPSGLSILNAFRSAELKGEAIPSVTCFDKQVCKIESHGGGYSTITGWRSMAQHGAAWRCMAQHGAAWVAWR
jgi:trimethylamine monooxygenase